MTKDKGLAARYAYEFWQAGYRVFPIQGARKTKSGIMCECGNPSCTAYFKHPVASNWQHTPLWDDEQIDNMVEYDQFENGFGVLCNGLLVVDVDARNGGVESFAKLCDMVPQISGAGMIVKTGSGGGSRHLYFRAPDGVSLVQHMPELPGIDFKANGFVIGPGSKHVSGNYYEIGVGGPDDVEDAPQGLIDLLRRPDRHRADYDGQSVDVSHQDIADMLAHIDPNIHYPEWLRVAMAIHHATGGTGFELWDHWSSSGDSYDSDKMGTHWHSFGRSANPVTLGTLVHYAEAGGWVMPVTFTGGAEFDFSEPVEARKDGLPFDLSGVDLSCPPGFVGKVAEWIENQSRRPRRKLSAAAALMAVGNISGLRYTDDRDGVTTNLFSFCVAGSRTGKEAIQQAVSEIHRAAGCAPATHGAIKSEQEIVKNLVRNQAAFYLIDEVGIFLNKVKNAQQKGGAAYLDGVIGMLMSAYSKASGFMLLTGDMKEDIRAQQIKELSALNKQDDSGDLPSWGKQRITQVQKTLAGLDRGLERPFLSLMGFTTPVTFDDLVDYQSAANGFIGRALIFQERETAPRSKRGFMRVPMSSAMAATFCQLYTGGDYDMEGSGRVEHYGDLNVIPTDTRAADMMDGVLDWFEDQAVDHKARTGLEALYLGAYELVSKVSLILAVPEGRRTVEHVRWAFALVRRDIDDKARLVTSNDRVKDAPKLALRSKIANVIDGDGETLGVIANRLRKYKREDIKKELDAMVSEGLAFREEFKAKVAGGLAERFVLSQG